MDIFEFALEKEKISQDYYRKLSDRVQNKGLEKIFDMLAGEEEKHYQIISKIRSDSGVEFAQTNVLCAAKGVFIKMHESMENFDFDISETELYKKAQQIEKNARDFYLQKAKEIAKPEQKGIFLRLAEEENKHYFLLDNIINFICRPENWLENAEFNHLEEY
ncbi:MAG: ferritin family protein [Planctomycetota bacterium]|jgi:rubrerythrin